GAGLCVAHGQISVSGNGGFCHYRYPRAQTVVVVVRAFSAYAPAVGFPHQVAPAAGWQVKRALEGVAPNYAWQVAVRKVSFACMATSSPTAQLDATLDTLQNGLFKITDEAKSAVGPWITALQGNADLAPIAAELQKLQDAITENHHGSISGSLSTLSQQTAAAAVNATPDSQSRLYQLSDLLKQAAGQVESGLQRVGHVHHGQAGVGFEEAREVLAGHGLVVDVHGVVGGAAAGQALVANEAGVAQAAHVEAVVAVVPLAPLLAGQLAD
nr:hypothetical protein [Tanacetum cinerariifolium]